MKPHSAAILVSVKPEFAAAIAEGRKTVELRRRFPEMEPGSWLVIYSTLPIGAVVGMAEIDGVVSGSVSAIWRSHGACAALTRRRYREYFAESAQATAVLLRGFVPLGPHGLRRLRSLFPGFSAPQSWRYLGHEELTILQDGPSPSGSAPAEAAE